jgi:hypothetical protein
MDGVRNLVDLIVFMAPLGSVVMIGRFKAYLPNTTLILFQLLANSELELL